MVQNQKLWNESNLCDYFLTLKDKYLRLYGLSFLALIFTQSR